MKNPAGTALFTVFCVLCSMLRSTGTLSKTAETGKTDGMQNIFRLFLTDENKNYIMIEE